MSALQAAVLQRDTANGQVGVLVLHSSGVEELWLLYCDA